MTTSKIHAFFVQRQRQISLPVRLYALVDGLLYNSADDATPLARSNGAIALFDDTPDASLADAGPWLIDYEIAHPQMHASLAKHTAGAIGVSWLVSAYSFAALAGELRERLDVRLPDGRVALLRFYDARVMPDIAKLFKLTQRVQFFSSTYDWLVETNGQLTGVHPDA
jgi:aromatic ring-cleaving dioxygenase